MKRREQVLQNKIKKVGNCQMCKLDLNAEFACMECRKRLICKNCAELHQRVPVLRSHKLLSMTMTTNHQNMALPHNLDIDDKDIKEKTEEFNLKPPKHIKLVTKIEDTFIDTSTVVFITSCNDGTVILVSPDHAFRIDSAANLVNKYCMAGIQANWQNATVYDGTLFLGSGEGFIAKIKLEATSAEIINHFNRYGEAFIAGITVVNADILLVSIWYFLICSVWRRKCTDLYEFNITTQEVIVKARNIPHPSMVSLADKGLFTKYIVTYENGNRESVNIYNHRWDLITKIDNPECDLHSHLVTPSGRLFIIESFSDKNVWNSKKTNRLVEYKFTGERTGEVLESNDLQMVAYSPPYLWTLHFPWYNENTDGEFRFKGKLNHYLVDKMPSTHEPIKHDQTKGLSVNKCYTVFFIVLHILIVFVSYCINQYM